MATEAPLIRDGSQTTSAANLSPTAGLAATQDGSGQFLAVKVTAARQINLANSGGEKIHGILQNKPLAGQSADIGIFGITKAVAGAAISPGAELMTDSSARVVAATSGNMGIGVAIEAAAAAGNIITVFVRPNGKQ